MSRNIIENKLIYNLDRVTGKRDPITADIFLTNFCNNRCPYCTYSRWEGLMDKSSYIGYNVFIALSLRLQGFGIKGMILTGGGEPTINPDFDLITSYLEEEKIAYGINTNFVRYKEFAPDYLKISLDAYDRRSYLKVRGVDQYETVINNIKKYIEWKDRTGAKTNIGLQLLVTDVLQIVDFYIAHKDIDFDYMIFRPYESTMGEYYQGTKMAQVPEILKMLEEISQRDTRVIVNYKWFNLEERFEKCHAHWSQIAVNEKAEIIYCCHKPYEVICSVFDNLAYEKWQEAKTDMTKCDIPCRLTGPNKFIREVDNDCANTSFI